VGVPIRFTAANSLRQGCGGVRKASAQIGRSMFAGSIQKETANQDGFGRMSNLGCLLFVKVGWGSTYSIWLPLLVTLQLLLFQRQACRLPHSAAKKDSAPAESNLQERKCARLRLFQVAGLPSRSPTRSVGRRLKITREGSAPSTSGCKPDVMLFHHRAKTGC
jgi:hypothetical protein